MIKLLNEDEREVVTKSIVIKMEERILITLNFNLNFLCPLIFLERFLRLANVEKNEKLVLLAKELCQRAVAKIYFLNYKPSQIAAASYLLAVNLSNTQNK
jgi:Cyclin, C-terminal domain